MHEMISYRNGNKAFFVFFKNTTNFLSSLSGSSTLNSEAATLILIYFA